VIEQLETMAEGNGVSVQLHSENSLYTSLNPELMKLLCLNLLMNALQHSPRGSVISVDALRSEDEVEIRICDEGEGIAQDVLPIYF